MRKLLAVFALLLIAATGARAQDVRIEVTEFGIYAVERAPQGRNSAGIGQSTVSNPRLAVSTHNIPAQLGVTFGFRYKVVGSSAGEEIELTKVTTFPSPGLRPPGAGAPIPKTERTLLNKIGETRFTSYVLSDDYEVVPGVWTIELWSGGRRLASESFTVMK
jgi:hypothetical protein